MSSLRFLAALPLGMLIGPAIADLGPIVITGTKTEVPQSESSVPVQVISAEQIRNSVASDAADLLQIYAGVDVARNGGYGKTTSVFMRGAESNHTVVLIDGVKINPATLGLAALQNISPAMIERIEIVKGPRSSIYGSEAIGGVINIITRRNVTGSELRVVAGAGEDDTSKQAASVHYGNDFMSGGVYLEAFDSDGFPVNDASDEDHGYDNDTVNAFLDFQLGRSDIRLSHWRTDGNVEYFSFGDLDQDFENEASSVVWNFAFSGNLSSNLRVSRMTDDIRQNQPNFLSELDFATTDRDEIELKLDYLTDSQLLMSLGLLTAEEDIEALSFGTSIEETNDIDATYVLLQQRDGRASYSLALRQTDIEDFDDETTWNIDYRHWLGDSSNFYVGLGTAFRAPDFTDRFGSGGNPDLDPEESENIELGLQHYLDPNHMVSITVFRNNIDDLISLDQNFVAQNIEEAEITGVELSYQAQRGDWSYLLSILSQDPQNKTLDEDLSRRARSRIGVNVGYRQESWQAGGSLIMVGPRDNSSFDTLTLAGYELFNLFLRYRITQSIDVSAKIENLFDEDYETAAGFNTKGRTAYVEFSFALLN